MKSSLAPAFLLLFSLGLHAQPVEVHEATIRDLQSAMSAGRITAVGLVDQYLARIAAYDDSGPQLNSLIRVNPLAREQAAALDAERARGLVRGPLHGIPVIIKDNYNTDFMPTTGASVALAGFIPSANATAVQKLVDAGAVVLAKANLHEFAYGITTISSLGGQTRNPYDPRRAPGGSSGGTAAAVAASLAAIGMGSDTCGSIRIPSAYNSLVGLRPSKGLGSIHGIMPLSHTQDVAGPLARNVEDLALVLDVIAGFDPLDPATAVMLDVGPPGFTAALEQENLSGLRVGRLTAYFEAAEPAVARVSEAALQRLREAGAEIVDVEIPDLPSLLARSGVIGHEFMADLDQYLALFLSNEVTSLDDVVDLGLYHQAVAGALTRSRESVRDDDAYAAAMALRSDLREAIEAVLSVNDLDAIAYPPIASLQAFTGEAQPGNNCSVSANSGLPAIAIPVGFTADGLPVGLELLGGYLQDARLVGMAWQWEKLNRPRQPPHTTPPLVSGEAPLPETAVVNFTSSHFALRIDFSADVTRQVLTYDVNNHSGDAADLYAIVLLTDEPEGFELNDPVLHNLASPGEVRQRGELLLTSSLWDAWRERRVYVKVFGRGLPVEGIPFAVIP
ncbi:MAG: hypothetical protein RLZZ385_1345 [Pseudomonadota bacterium]|jgi:Asp-tRNA(Asn)/Glu-tRNA(Gln) amidotransferase A subunit family amidase